jgi:hypothetical protein
MPAATRTRILDGAIAILRNGNPSDVRPFTISATTGVSASLINYHFPDPDTIAPQAAIAHLREYTSLERNLLGDDSRESLPLLQEWIRHRAEWTRKCPGITAVLVAPHVYGLERYEEWHQLNRSLIDGLTPHILAIRKASLEDAKKHARILNKIGFLPLREVEEFRELFIPKAILDNNQAKL